MCSEGFCHLDRFRPSINDQSKHVVFRGRGPNDLGNEDSMAVEEGADAKALW